MVKRFFFDVCNMNIYIYTQTFQNLLFDWLLLPETPLFSKGL